MSRVATQSDSTYQHRTASTNLEASAKPVADVRRPLRVRWSEFILLIATVDLIIMNFSLWLGLSLRESFPRLNTEKIILWTVVLSMLWQSVSFSLGTYIPQVLLSRSRSALNADKAALVTWLLYHTIPYLSPILPTRRIEAVYPMIVSWLFLSAWRVVASSLTHRPEFRHRIMLLGHIADPVLEESLLQSQSPMSHSYHEVLGVIDDRPPTNSPFPYLGTWQALDRLSSELSPDELVLATDLKEVRQDVVDAIIGCHEKGIQVTTTSNFIEGLLGKVPLQQAFSDLRVALPLLRSPGHRIYMLAKRSFDCLVGVVGCAATLAVLPIVAVGNRINSPGPLFYSQPRVGRGGREFKVYKFRSMVDNAESETGAVFAQENDPRITAFGRFLRRCRLDEFPQFWNILVGDMSLVGPRPERPEFVHTFQEKMPLYRARHAVRPGLTGWAQVRYPYGSSWEDTLEKLQYDLYYVKFQSLYLDYLIFVQTFEVVLGFKGR